MGPMNVEKRVRAWALIQATDTNQKKVVNKIRQLDKKEKKLVVIRVDLVVGGDANIVASLDAAESNYEDTMTKIRAITEITNVSFLKVTHHNPELPHNASGYVTEYEAKHPKSEKKNVKVGRQDNSPGFNPWG